MKKYRRVQYGIMNAHTDKKGYVHTDNEMYVHTDNKMHVLYTLTWDWQHSVLNNENSSVHPTLRVSADNALDLFRL